MTKSNKFQGPCYGILIGFFLLVVLAQTSFAQTTEIDNLVDANDIPLVEAWMETVHPGMRLPPPKVPTVRFLIIANDDYGLSVYMGEPVGSYETLSDLPGVKRDRELILEKLTDMQVSSDQITEVINFETSDSFYIELEDKFLSKIEPNDMVVVLYSGHGFNYQGFNYLLPTSTPRKFKDPDDIFLKTVPLNNLLEEIYQFDPSFVLFFYDACRNIPEISASLKLEKGPPISHRGLPRRWKEKRKNTTIVYADREGYTVETGASPNLPSLFSKNVAANVNITENVGEIIAEIITDVELESGDTQFPDTYGWSKTNPVLNSPPELWDESQKWWLDNFLLPAVDSINRRDYYTAETILKKYVKRFSTNIFANQAKFILENELFPLGQDDPNVNQAITGALPVASHSDPTPPEQILGFSAMSKNGQLKLHSFNVSGYKVGGIVQCDPTANSISQTINVSDPYTPYLNDKGDILAVTDLLKARLPENTIVKLDYGLYSPSDGFDDALFARMNSLRRSINSQGFITARPSIWELKETETPYLRVEICSFPKNLKDLFTLPIQTGGLYPELTYGQTDIYSALMVLEQSSITVNGTR